MFTNLLLLRWVSLSALLILVFVHSPAIAQIYPEPAPPLDDAHFGANVRRTMNLLATSTPEKRNTVHIIFYGQSITAGQPWVTTVINELKSRYPYANIIAEDKAVSGFASQRLVNAAELDIYPAYPDLVIFHVYGSHIEYENIIRRIRERTTAEILITNDHIEGNNPTDSLGNYTDEGWTASMYTYTRNFAKTYNCEYVDLRADWKRYLKDNGYLASQLLNDNVHLNAHGNYLYASLVLRQLIHRPDLDAEAEGLTEDYVIGEDIDWDMETGVLNMPFAGNRVDAIYDEQPSETAAEAEVWLDGQIPSTFPEFYVHTRPSPNPWSSRPVFNRADSNNPKIVEDWTMTITSVNGTSFNYSVAGSITGADGSGANTANFISNSGRVVISGDADHWFDGRFVPDHARAAIGQKITWKTVPLFSDTVSYEPVDNAIQGTQVLFKGATHSRHMLQLSSSDPANVGLKMLRVYRPSWNRAKKFWADVDELAFPSVVNANATIKLTAEGSWRIAEIPEWLEAAPASGSGDTAIEITTKEVNPTEEERAGTIRINMGSEQPLYLTVEQAPGDIVIPPPVSYFVDDPVLSGWRVTDWGYIYDELWPFAFHAELGWVFVVHEGDSIFFWNFADSYWGWTAHNYLPWYYAFTEDAPGWR